MKSKNNVVFSSLEKVGVDRSTFLCYLVIFIVGFLMYSAAMYGAFGIKEAMLIILISLLIFTTLFELLLLYLIKLEY